MVAIKLELHRIVLSSSLFVAAKDIPTKILPVCQAIKLDFDDRFLGRSVLI